MIEFYDGGPVLSKSMKMFEKSQIDHDIGLPEFVWVICRRSPTAPRIRFDFRNRKEILPDDLYKSTFTQSCQPANCSTIVPVRGRILKKYHSVFISAASAIPVEIQAIENNNMAVSD